MEEKLCINDVAITEDNTEVEMYIVDGEDFSMGCVLTDLEGDVKLEVDFISVNVVGMREVDG